jgi:hypothetical protein
VAAQERSQSGDSEHDVHADEEQMAASRRPQLVPRGVVDEQRRRQDRDQPTNCVRAKNASATTEHREQVAPP